MNKKTKLVLAVSSYLLYGCTNITISSKDNDSSHFIIGFPTIKIENTNKATTIKTESVGLVKTLDTFNIGYLNEVYFMSGGECQLILFEPNIDNVKELKRILGDNTKLCTINGVNVYEVD